MFEDSYRTYREKQGRITYLDAIKANKATIAGYSMMISGTIAIFHGLDNPHLVESSAGALAAATGSYISSMTAFGIDTYSTMEDVKQALENTDNQEEKIEALYRTNKNQYCTRCAVEKVAEQYGLEKELNDL